jgi:hypothetical protein
LFDTLDELFDSVRLVAGGPHRAVKLKLGHGLYLE